MTSARDLAAAFVTELASQASQYAFNPYSDICELYDKLTAHNIRRQNLEDVLEASLTRGVEVVWVGRDLGYRGGRRTGLAFTDDLRLGEHAALAGSPELQRATLGTGQAERTASVIWEALSFIQCSVMLWNVFPLHPHLPGAPLTNRAHSSSERALGRPFLAFLLEALQPDCVVAVGRDAQLAMAAHSTKVIPVRHPSYGGQSEFRDGVLAHFGLRADGARNRIVER